MLLLSRLQYLQISYGVTKRLLLFLIVLCSGPLSSHYSAAETIELPITLDYPLLQALLVQSSYTDAGETAQLINEGDGCINLILSKPEFSGVERVVNFSTQIFLHAGTPLGGNCFLPFQWEGSIEFSQIPHLDEETWELTFETVNTTVFSSEKKPVTSLNVIWERIMPVINSYMRGFSVKLAPPLTDLRNFLLPLFEKEAQADAELLLRTIRPGGLIVNQRGLIATVQADVSGVDGAEESEPPEVLTDKELNTIIQLWETWDSLLVYLVSLLSEQPLSAAEHQILIDLLLDTRYEFVSKINDQNVERDFVREQFISAWRHLAPIFRNHLLYNPAESKLGYLSFFTAADALMTLDKLGPTFGVVVSRNGLIRLARTLGDDSLLLNYLPEVNSKLQQLFEVSPMPEEPATIQEKDLQVPEKKQDKINDAFIDILINKLFSTAYAGNLPSFSEIKKWQVPDTSYQEYLERVRNLLSTASVSLVVRSNIPEDIQRIYKSLIPAIAWQESCFRQFVVKDKKLTYLLSYNNSSVGLMQVNERVWRGIYDRQRLRWDIHYNARAGCEIVNLYLQKYILPKSGPELLADKDTLAHLVYAMYNGGPSQYEKFLKRKSKGTQYESDLLFQQKYSWVESQDWSKLDKCL
ncbi:MAG: lytic transglycosylase domain-containing protein [Deltaproteobacteria bacterium]|nr:lytic transglycosylase domain-containing protein [Deltaproteobacteria bacterium]